MFLKNQVRCLCRRRNHDCRICKKTFCCSDCRRSHEEHEHGDLCDICVNGATFIRDQAEQKLLNHINEKHTPLRCLQCKMVFDSVTSEHFSQHRECCVKEEQTCSPRTPGVSRSSYEPSPVLTPFSQNALPHSEFEMKGKIAATSTPLQEDSKQQGTPENQVDINNIYKSSLKLTGSGPLASCKKNDRKVTFSETPILSSNKPLELMNKAANDDDVDADNSYCSTTSTKEEFETATSTLPLETAWITATANISENYQDENIDPEEEEEEEEETQEETNRSISIWTSVTDLMKSVYHNLSGTCPDGNASKRSRPEYDSEDDFPNVKRPKILDLKCRKPIRVLAPLFQIRLARLRFVDKATQTDDYLFYN